MPEFDSTIEYRDVPGFPGYKVGSDGTMWGCRLPGGYRDRRIGSEWKRLKPTPQSAVGGHLYVTLRNNGSHRKFVHRLVLEAFVGPCPDGMECRHFPDRDGANNRLENLSWGTHQENMNDRLIHGTHNRGERQGSVKLDTAKVLEIRRRRRAGEGGSTLAKAFKISPQTVCDIIKRRRWFHLPEEV